MVVSELGTTHESKRWRRITAVGAAALACLGFGLTTASTDSYFGPHSATYDVTTDSQVTADFGPLGTLELDSPVPGPLGIKVTVHEIPADLTAIGTNPTDEALAQDIDSYIRFFSAPQRTISDVLRALAIDTLARALIAAIVLAASWLGLSMALGPERRQALATNVSPHAARIAATSTVCAIVLTSATASALVPAEPQQGPSSVLAGTPLKDARLTGRLATVLDTYGNQAVNAYRANEAFYNTARDNLAVAWNSRPTGPPVNPHLTPGSPLDGENLVRILVVSDLHCNTGMARVIGELARAASVDVVLDAGDTTMNGTAVEKVCVDAFASALPSGVPVVVASGNHDSEQTSAQQRSHGQIVLDGTVTEVSGVRILGDTDPRDTRVGEGTSTSGEPLSVAADRLAEVASKDAAVDLLLVHDPAMGDPALANGTVTFQVSGHTHTRMGPEVFGRGVRFVSGSTAGAASGNPTLGPLSSTAEMTVLRFDPQTRRFVDAQIVSVDSSGSVRVERAEVPAPPE